MHIIYTILKSYTSYNNNIPNGLLLNIMNYDVF